MPSGIAIDTSEFEAALSFYMRHTKRDLAYVVNKRAINVSYKAMRFTPSASPKKIERELRKRMARPGRKGKGRPPLAALLIAKGKEYKNRVVKPKPGLYGAEMRERIQMFIRSRQRSRGYVKAGWLKVIRDFERKVPGRKKRKPRNVQDFRKLPGEGRIAKPGLNPTAEVINHAIAARKIAKAPLQRALNSDAEDMKIFTMKRLIKRAKQYNR